MACSIPSNRSHCSESSAAAVANCSGSVTSISSTSASTGQLPGRATGQGQASTGAGEHDLGSLGLGRAGDGERQGRVGQHAGHQNPFTLEQSHQRARLSSMLRSGRIGALWKGRQMRIGILGGTGPAGRGLAVRLAAAGDEVVIGSRDAERASTVAGGLRDAWPDHPLAVTGAANE